MLLDKINLFKYFCTSCITTQLRVYWNQLIATTSVTLTNGNGMAMYWTSVSTSQMLPILHNNKRLVYQIQSTNNVPLCVEYWVNVWVEKLCKFGNHLKWWLNACFWKNSFLDYRKLIDMVEDSKPQTPYLMVTNDWKYRKPLTWW